MRMFGKVLASFGFGSAKVDTRLEKATYRQGELVRGDIFVQGGKAEQKIDSIYIYLVLQNYIDDQQEEYILDEILLSDSFTIDVQETKVIPFQFHLPYDTPVTTGGCSIYFKTGLDVKMAVDPDDHDGIEVLPCFLIDKIIKTVEQIGFQLHSVEFDNEMFHERHPFVQKYKFIPIDEYAAVVDNIKLIFYPSSDKVDVVIHVYNKANDLRSSVEEMLEMGAHVARFTIYDGEPNLLQQLKDQIDQCIST